MVEILESAGIDGKNIRLSSNLYLNQKAAMRIENEMTGWIEVKRGVKRGCIFPSPPPDLFSLYSQVVMNALEDLEGISIDGRNVNNIRYADDTVLIADSEKKLQALINKLKDERECKGQRINIDKINT